MNNLLRVSIITLTILSIAAFVGSIFSLPYAGLLLVLSLIVLGFLNFIYKVKYSPSHAEGHLDQGKLILGILYYLSLDVSILGFALVGMNAIGSVYLLSVGVFSNIFLTLLLVIFKKGSIISLSYLLFLFIIVAGFIFCA